MQWVTASEWRLAHLVAAWAGKPNSRANTRAHQAVDCGDVMVMVMVITFILLVRAA